MINGSFVFGLDDDDKDAFKNCRLAVKSGLTTATFHILTPYLVPRLYQQMQRWPAAAPGMDRYDTRQVVYKTVGLTAEELKAAGYDWAYRSLFLEKYMEGWPHECSETWGQTFYLRRWMEKFEPLWNFIIKTKGLNNMLPVLEAILSKCRTAK